MGLHMYRVLVRGRFGDLDPATRDRLLADADSHSVFDAEFTPKGTLTYDRRLVGFTFRYEMRESGDDPLGAVTARAIEQASSDLDCAGIAHGELSVAASDMADVWAGRRATST